METLLGESFCEVADTVISWLSCFHHHQSSVLFMFQRLIKPYVALVSHQQQQQKITQNSSQRFNSSQWKIIHNVSVCVCVWMETTYGESISFYLETGSAVFIYIWSVGSVLMAITQPLHWACILLNLLAETVVVAVIQLEQTQNRYLKKGKYIFKTWGSSTQLTGGVYIYFHGLTCHTPDCSSASNHWPGSQRGRSLMQ